MEDELIDYVVYLIDSKKGDLGRLNYILSTLQDHVPLYNSDKKYLDSLISTYLGTPKKKFGDQKNVDELKKDLNRLKDRLEKIEKRGYTKPVGRKAIFFFVTFFFGWHVVTTLINNKFIQDIRDSNPYLFPIYLLDKIIPGQYLNYLSQINLSIPKIVVLVWAAMILSWIVLGFVYLVRFIHSRYNPKSS